MSTVSEDDTEVDVGLRVSAQDTLALVGDFLASDLVLRGHVDKDDVHDAICWKLDATCRVCEPSKETLFGGADFGFALGYAGGRSVGKVE